MSLIHSLINALKPQRCAWFVSAFMSQNEYNKTQMIRCDFHGSNEEINSREPPLARRISF
jgi:hypothetical protein